MRRSVRVPSKPHTSSHQPGSVGSNTTIASACQRRPLQRRIARTSRLAPTDPVVFVAFDLLWLDGHELVDAPWQARRPRLEGLAGHGLVIGPVFDDLDALAEASRDLQLEGCVAKRRDSLYQPGRRSRGAWLKCTNTTVSRLWAGGLQRTVRCRHLPALLFGEPDPTTGMLQYRGCVEAAVIGAQRLRLVAGLARCTRPTSPFTGGPRGTAVQWVEPEPALVVEIRHTLGRPGQLREPVLLAAVDVDPL